MRKIELVDLKTQYSKLKPEIDAAVTDVIESCAFINGPAVKNFEKNLSKYLGDTNVVPCANGTDALQICIMALGLKPGDEVITPTFTYAATAEVIALLGLIPRFVDVDPDTFNLDPAKIEEAITSKTKAIIPVHLFGQSVDMEPLMSIAEKHELLIIEDLAQAIGARYTFKDGSESFTGNMGDIGGTSFFPSKNLGCYGDGGAIVSNKKELADLARKIANHGQSSLYYHDILGVNSRLDSMQAAVLNVKLEKLNDYNSARKTAAEKYNTIFKDVSCLQIPVIHPSSTHVFHQYTLKCLDGSRNDLKSHLDQLKIPNKIYYPVCLHLQKAYNLNNYKEGDFPVAENLAETVISLPMHTELDDEQIGFIGDAILNFYKSK